MNDSGSVSVIDQTHKAMLTSWKDKPSAAQQYFYWSSALVDCPLDLQRENPEAVSFCQRNCTVVRTEYQDLDWWSTDEKNRNCRLHLAQLETKFARGKIMAYDEMPQIWQKEMQGQKDKLIQSK